MHHALKINTSICAGEFDFEPLITNGEIRPDEPGSSFVKANGVEVEHGKGHEPSRAGAMARSTSRASSSSVSWPSSGNVIGNRVLLEMRNVGIRESSESRT